MVLKSQPEIQKTEQLWQQLAIAYALKPEQLAQMKHYAQMLMAYNVQHNLTAITDETTIIMDHFWDSLALAKAIDLAKIKGLADVGSGGGFPGIPLKIMYPALPVILIEVTTKKVEFLRQVIAALQLPAIEVSDLDWRTFLRTTHYPIDLFCARASLRPDELIRAFGNECHYQQATIVYWASQQWQIGPKEKPFFEREVAYQVDAKQRRLVFFKKLKN